MRRTGKWTTTPANRNGRVPAGLVILVLVAIATMVAPRTCSSAAPVLRLSDRVTIGFPSMVEEVADARVILVGEDHQRTDNHAAQLALIMQLHEQDVPFAIGLEMFTAPTQGKLDRWVAGTLSRNEFIRLYYREWAMPWPLYQDIFLYAREHRIPLIALNVPRAITRKVARKGFAALTPKERKQIPEGITCSVDPAYRAMIREAFSGHAHNGKSFDHFCEAQMLWNKTMAWYVRKFLGRDEHARVVVLAGVGHAMKGGIPQELASYGQGYEYQVILPELPQFSRNTTQSSTADYLLLFGDGTE